MYKSGNIRTKDNGWGPYQVVDILRLKHFIFWKWWAVVETRMYPGVMDIELVINVLNDWAKNDNYG